MKRYRNDLTQGQLKSLLRYDVNSGDFTWINSGKGRRIGVPVGSKKSKEGYIRIALLGKRYQAHRLVWLYVFGNFPEEELDHKNGNRSDNRLENLRECLAAEQPQNQKVLSTNTSGHPNVYWYRPYSKWLVQIWDRRRPRFFGYYEDFTDACVVAKAAKAKLHTFNPVHRGVTL